MLEKIKSKKLFGIPVFVLALIGLSATAVTAAILLTVTTTINIQEAFELYLWGEGDDQWHLVAGPLDFPLEWQDEITPYVGGKVATFIKGKNNAPRPLGVRITVTPQDPSLIDVWFWNGGGYYACWDEEHEHYIIEANIKQQAQRVGKLDYVILGEIVPQETTVALTVERLEPFTITQLERTCYYGTGFNPVKIDPQNPKEETWYWMCKNLENFENFWDGDPEYYGLPPEIVDKINNDEEMFGEGFLQWCTDYLLCKEYLTQTECEYEECDWDTEQHMCTYYPY